MNKDYIINNLNKLLPDAHCELNYNKDYELLIAVMLSAQSTDKRVNEVSKILFSKYNLFDLNNMDVKEIEKIIKPVGTYHKKAVFIKKIAESLINNYDGKVPNNREYLESLPGVGHKTTNVVLANLYGISAFAVDTHVMRVSKRLGIADENDSVLKIEEKINKFFPKENWNKLNDQFILFGRYYCKAQNPKCEECPFKDFCKYKKVI
jgi:endonuclease III